MKHSVSDAQLSKLWSRAVIAKYKRCPVTGRVDGLQAHHAVAKGRQNRFSIRWEIRNGVALSAEAHRKLHDGDLDVQKIIIEYIENRGDLEYLMNVKYMLKDEFLSTHVGMSEDEYRLHVRDELKRIIEEGEC